MKKKDLERQLKKEIDAAAPSDFQSLIARCGNGAAEKVPVAEPVVQTADGKGIAGGTGRRALSLVLAAVLLFSCAVFAVIACILGAGSGAGGATPGRAGYFIFDINPSVELSYDENGEIAEATGLNEDGEVLLCGLELTGKNYSAAADLLFERCVKLGYFSAARENNAVLLSANYTEGGKDEEMTDMMKRLFSDRFSTQKIPGVVITGVENEELNAGGAQYGIDGQKYALILDYLELGGQLEESEYATIPIRDLYAGISQIQKEEKEEQISKLEKAQEEIREQLFKTLSEEVQNVIEELQNAIDQLEDGRPGNWYRERMERLEELAEKTEEAETAEEFSALVSDILDELKKLSEREPPFSELNVVAQGAYFKILGITSRLNESMRELDFLNVSPEEENSARMDKFGDAPGGEKDFDDDWREEKEKEIASSWYDFKQKWEEERKQDLFD